MAGTLFLREGKRTCFNRLRQGPTWGLSRASKRLADLAQQGKLTHSDVQKVLSYYPKLAQRMHSVGIQISELEKGSSRAVIARLFRNALYAAQASENFRLQGFAVKHGEASTYPDLQEMQESMRHLSLKDIDAIAELVEVEYSLTGKVLELLHRIPVIAASMLIGCGLGIWFFARYGVLSGIFKIETEIFRNMLDMATGSVSGTVVGRLPYILTEDVFENKQREAVGAAAWRSLNDFAQAETALLGQEQDRQVKEILDILQPKSARNYLAALGYEKIKLIYPEYKGPETRTLTKSQLRAAIDWALVRAQDTPEEELKRLIHSRHNTVASHAFERVKASLSPGELETLLQHEIIDIRRKAFDLLAGQLDKEKLKNLPPMINIPALFDHPQVSRETKYWSLLKTFQTEPCQELLEKVFPQLNAKEIGGLFNVLSSPMAVNENIDVFVKLAREHPATPRHILSKIAEWQG